MPSFDAQGSDNLFHCSKRSVSCGGMGRGKREKRRLSLAVFGTAPQLTERLEQAKGGEGEEEDH